MIRLPREIARHYRRYGIDAQLRFRSDPVKLPTCTLTVSQSWLEAICTPAQWRRYLNGLRRRERRYLRAPWRRGTWA